MNKVRLLRNHIESSSRVMIVAASVIIVCLVCGFSFYVAREGKNTGGKVTGEFMAFASEYQDVDRQLYDGMDVSGREIIRLIETLDSTDYLAVKVNTKMSTGVCYNKFFKTTDKVLYDNATATPVSDLTTTHAIPSNAAYINETATFTGAVHRDSNDVIVCIEFTQQ